jgi:hypothetical protein
MPREELRRRVFARRRTASSKPCSTASRARGGRGCPERRWPSPITRCGCTPQEADVRASLLAADAPRTGRRGPRAPPRRSGRGLAACSRRWRARLVAEGACGGWGTPSWRVRAWTSLKDEVRRRWPPGSRLDVAGFKEMTASAASS